MWPSSHKVPMQILDFLLSLPVCRQQLKRNTLGNQVTRICALTEALRRLPAVPARSA
jgi:hypothetical protein